MKSKVLAGLALAGVLAVAGAASANVTATIIVDDMPRFANRAQAHQLPPEFDRKRPPMSRDRRMPPPGAHSRDKRPPEMNGKRPPMPPHSGDRRPPEFNGKRPQMPKGR